MINENVVIDPSAKIADDVSIGPWCYIGPNVEIAKGCQLDAHVVITQNTKIGENNHIFSFACLGGDPQDMSYQGETTYLELGDNNVIREYVTINRGSVRGDGMTRIGNNNLLLAYSHIAHDCVVGNEILLVNNATTAGYVKIDDHAILGAFTAVHQYCHIGSYSFLSRATKVTKDIPPYMLVTGVPGIPCGLNTVGLKRRGFSKATIAELRKAFLLIYRSGLKLREVREQLGEMEKATPEIALITSMMDNSSRGIARINPK